MPHDPERRNGSVPGPPILEDSGVSGLRALCAGLGAKALQEDMPLLPSGKVDRQKLLAGAGKSSKEGGLRNPRVLLHHYPV